MKFVIGLIALIFIALAVYVFTGKSGKDIAKSTVTHKMNKTEAIKAEVAKPINVAKEADPSSKQKVQKNDKMSVKSTSSNEGQVSTSSENEIGKGLTLESIENANVSEDKKEQMITDILYQQSLNTIDEPSLTEEDVLRLIDEDLKNGLLN